MKGILFIILFLFVVANTDAQQNTDDSLRNIINLQKGDRAQVDAIVYSASQQKSLDSTIKFAEVGSSIAKKLKYKKGEADCLLVYENINAQQGNFSQAIQYALDALAIYKNLNNYVGIVSAHAMLQALYREVGDYHNSLLHAFQALQIATIQNTDAAFLFPGHQWTPLLLAEIGQTYVLMNKLDSAFLYTQKSIALKEHFNGAEWGFPVYLMATILNMKGQYNKALENYRTALVLTMQNRILNDTLQIFSGLSTLFKNMGQQDSAIHYSQIVARGWNHQSEYKNLLEAVRNLALVYKEKGNSDSALKYTELSNAVKDSIFSAEKDRDVQRIAFNTRMKEAELKAAKIKYENRIQLYVFIAGLLALLIIAAVLWYSNRQKQKVNAKIELAYRQLKATQAQLIQREKMASLGELTAGIAHEIQNPLNFVNNFSETNMELIEEAETEFKNGNHEQGLFILNDLKENEQKINQHGKRADSIVKGMLEHSRISKGEKQATDLNASTEEYLRLAYHGFWAKDKNFNAAIETSFDRNIGKIDIIPQDVGRVLLNLFNNAFWAVNEKQKQTGDGYEPTVTVSTKKENDKVEIIVKDNGNGIPQQVVDKIFQPFFTTKPTGEGTGLGLSLSYDIVKAHGGELIVDGSEGEGTVFRVHLPMEVAISPTGIVPKQRT